METPKALEQFRNAAADYCSWVEGSPADPLGEARIAWRLLPKVLHLIHDVPEAEPDSVADKDFLTKGDNTLPIYRRFAALPFNYYREIWNPHEIESADEPVTGDLADDLMDLYLDLKQGLLYFDAGRPAQAAFHWTFMYGVHWGRHATSALRALHCYLADPALSDPDDTP